MFGITSDKAKADNPSSSSKQSTSSSNVVQNDEPKVIEQTQAQKDSIAKVEHDVELAEIKKNTITASNLTAQYEANEVAADNNFKNKTFYVSGTVTDIKKDIMGDIYVVLKGSEMFRDVQCFFENSDIASQLQKGMRITFKGTCDGLMMNVLMKDCVLVQ